MMGVSTWRQLHDALRDGKLEKASALLKSNPDLVSREDEWGNTPLHDAIINGRKDGAELLLAHNADINVRGKSGWMPLHLAAAFGNKDLAEFLLARNADVNPQNKSGYTPWHYAAVRGQKAVAELLRSHGGIDFWGEIQCRPFGRDAGYIATGRVGDNPIYEIDPQTWARGSEVLQYLFVESHCRGLERNQELFLGCDGVIFSVEDDEIVMHVTRREASPWLRCGPSEYAYLYPDSENPLLVYPLRDVKDWQYLICLELERLNRGRYNAIGSEQFDLARNDQSTFHFPLSSLKLHDVDSQTSKLEFSLSDFPAGLSDEQFQFLERVLGGAEVIRDVKSERGDDWKKISISFPSKSRIIANLDEARSYGANIAGVGYGLFLVLVENYSFLGIDFGAWDLFTLPWSVIGARLNESRA